MNVRDPHPDVMPCNHCGQRNEPRAAYCDGCGMEMHPAERPELRPDGHGARKVLLSRSLASHDLDRLWSTFEAVQGCPWFPSRVLWPEEDDGGRLLQELPGGTVLLAEAMAAFRTAAPTRGWLGLVSGIASAIDDIQQSGCRLNSVGLGSIILTQNTYEFVGLCLPMCLTHLDTPRTEMSPAGIDCCFAAPEMQGYVEHPAGPAVDVYTLAVLTYYLLSGEPPRDLVECGFFPVKDHPEIGPSLKECLEDSLAFTPERRPRSAGLFVERLRKALVKDHCRTGPDLRFASLTDIGLGGRENNEDSCGVWMRGAADAHGQWLIGVAAVADGMGGSAFGERASSFCIDRILDDSARNLQFLGDALASPAAWTTACRNWLLGLNRDVIDLGRQLAAPNDVGSTLTAVLFAGRRAFLLHAGDSRLYLLRSGSVSRLTRIQTYAEQLHQEGLLTLEEIGSSIYRNVLTSYVGSPKCDPQVEELDLVPGDALVLCSDGLMEGLTEQDMHDLAVRLPPDEAVVEMVRRCKYNLGTVPSDPDSPAGIPCSDNMTAVVVQIMGTPSAKHMSPPGVTQSGAMTSVDPVLGSPGTLTSKPSEGEPDA